MCLTIFSYLIAFSSSSFVLSLTLSVCLLCWTKYGNVEIWKAGIIDVFDEILLDTIPIMLGGDLNIDLNSTEGTEFLEFLRDTWKLELISDPAI